MPYYTRNNQVYNKNSNGTYVISGGKLKRQTNKTAPVNDLKQEEAKKQKAYQFVMDALNKL